MELEQGDVYVGPPTEKQIRLRSHDALLRFGVEGIVNIRAPVGIIVSSAGRHAISLSGEAYAEALTAVSRPGLDSTVDKAAPRVAAIVKWTTDLVRVGERLLQRLGPRLISRITGKSVRGQIALDLLEGASTAVRIQQFRAAGVDVPNRVLTFTPRPLSLA